MQSFLLVVVGHLQPYTLVAALHIEAFIGLGTIEDGLQRQFQ